jgi:hypothetical protein
MKINIKKISRNNNNCLMELMSLMEFQQFSQINNLIRIFKVLLFKKNYRR